MNSRQWSEMLAREVRENFRPGGVTDEQVLVETFHVRINEILTEEHRNVLRELTELAFQEQDSDKRASYFKIARLVQKRIPN
jgi:hypothetical protein